MHISCITDLNGNKSSDHSGGLIGTTIDLCLSRVSTSVTWPDGMRRSIPTKISQKLLRYGWPRAPTGADATGAGALWQSCGTWIASLANYPKLILFGAEDV